MPLLHVDFSLFSRVRYWDFHLVYQINFPFDILDIWYASGKKKRKIFTFSSTKIKILLESTNVDSCITMISLRSFVCVVYWDVILARYKSSSLTIWNIVMGVLPVCETLLLYHMLISVHFLIALHARTSDYLCKYFIKRIRIWASPCSSDIIEHQLLL